MLQREPDEASQPVQPDNKMVRQRGTWGKGGGGRRLSGWDFSYVYGDFSSMCGDNRLFVSV